MKLKTLKLISALSMGVFAQYSLAGNIIGIDVSALPNNQKLVKVKFDRDVQQPSGFTIPVPARIALDFPNTTLRLAQPELKFKDPLLEQLTAAQANNRARLMLSLSEPAQYNAKVKGNEVLIYVQAAKVGTAQPNQPAAQPDRTVNTPTAAATTAPKKESSPSPAVLTSKNFAIDFRRGNNGVGIIDINTAGIDSNPKVERLVDRLIITYQNSPLATELQRNLDVSDFATPVRSVALRRLGNDTQLTILTEGNWDFSQVRNGTLNSISVTPVVSAENEGLIKEKKEFTGKKVTLDFQNIDIRTILQILAKESGLNIVASDSVTGQMTINLHNVPWDQALDLVLETRNLEMRKDGNIITVAPRQELLAQDKANLEAQGEIQNLGPLFSRTFQLKFKNVSEFKDILHLDQLNIDGRNRNSILSPRGSALIDPSTNTLIINDIASVIQKFDRLVKQLDVPAQQVMVEARIVQAQDGVARQLGVKFGYQGIHGNNLFDSTLDNAFKNSQTIVDNATARNNFNDQQAFNTRVRKERTDRAEKALEEAKAEGDAEKIDAARAAYKSALDSTETFTPSPVDKALSFLPNINLPASAATNAISVVRALASGALGLELQAMQQDNKVKIVSSPRVLTQDRKEAVIQSGTQVPYRNVTKDGEVSTSFKDAVLGLKVTPQITPDGNIIMDVQINKDAVDASCSNDQPCISTNNLSTQVMVENGGTLVLGGIFEEENSDNVNKVPLLGDIPVLGHLFKSNSKQQSRKELLIFITPKIMNTGSVLRY